MFEKHQIAALKEKMTAVHEALDKAERVLADFLAAVPEETEAKIDLTEHDTQEILP